MGQLLALLTENWMMLTAILVGGIIVLEFVAELLGPPGPP